MAVPARPTSGAPIATDWGDVAHDTAVAQDIQYGTATVTTTTAVRQDAPPITFPRPFAAPPAVIAMVANGFQNLATGIASPVTATGFTACVMNNAGGAMTAGQVLTISWVAIGARA